jgi:hypothetical protein
MKLGISAVFLIFGTAFPLLAQTTAKVGRSQQFPGGALKEEISVSVEHLDTLLKQADAANTKPVLFLNGQEMTNVFGRLAGAPDDSGKGTLLFALDRDASNRDAWKPFLSQPSLHPAIVRLSVGLHGQQPIPSDWVNFQLTVLHVSWLVAWTILFLFLLVVFVWKARTTPLLREEGVPPGGGLAAYSLAKSQMAWWFFLVLAAYLLLYMVTWDFNTITAGTLGLIGISAGTGLAGAIVDSSKQDQFLAERKQLQAEQATAPAAARAAEITARLAAIDTQLETAKHQDFLSDILTDAEGYSFHRFQMLVWTIVLGVVFMICVYNDLIMPDFGATLLGLMGISSGTYVGFKFPETKN